MSQKNIAAVLLAVATVLGGPYAVDQAVDLRTQSAASVTISGPTEARVGELVELHLSGSRPTWLLPVEDARELGDSVVVSFRTEGEYQVIGSAIASGQTSVVKHVIRVGEPEPQEPEEADEPEKPEPQTSTLPDDVYRWCVETEAPRAAVKKLGENFNDAATRSNSLDELLQNVAVANRKVNQKGCEQVLARIQQYLFENLQGEDLDAHVDTFNEIAEGLTRYTQG